MERLHMNDIQEIIYRLRKGQSVEAIHRDTGHAKKTIRKYRNLADKHGFLEKNRGLPASSELAAVLGPVRQCKVRSVALALRSRSSLLVSRTSRSSFCIPDMC
jgi:hypothetical protein